MAKRNLPLPEWARQYFPEENISQPAQPLPELLTRPAVRPASITGRYTAEYKQSLKNHPMLIATLTQEWHVSENEVRSLLQNEGLLGSVSDETVDKIVGRTGSL